MRWAAELICRNSVGPLAVSGETDADESGLGAQLIRAFVMQLGAELDVTETETEYSVRIRFEIEEFRPDPPDF